MLSTRVILVRCVQDAERIICDFDVHECKLNLHFFNDVYNWLVLAVDVVLTSC